ncbi:PP2C family protein-serine/threonine phosphatase [Acidipila sp. EB88]|uniref:PP2C family protein-serine/threonine phosphatase n=1 Tax=Acidipila sp. EB88 TaxID=2305226 RepID=UPI0013155D37|nr:SpoIIE family protein phosphatase [Acidipila sp. EB88]
MAAILFAGSLLPGAFGGFCSGLEQLSLVLLVILFAILGYRWLVHRLLWTVRNRLIVTCLLMGLAPVVMFGTLAAIAAYLFSGQFATSLAIVALDQSLVRVRNTGDAFAVPITHTLKQNPQAHAITIPLFEESSLSVAEQKGFALSAWCNGHPLLLRTEEAGANLRQQKQQQAWFNAPLGHSALPAWLHAGFKGVVKDDDRLFLRTVTEMEADGNDVIVVASLPVDQSTLNDVATGLGTVKVSPSFNTQIDEPEPSRSAQRPAAHAKSEMSFNSLQGGTLVPASRFFDTRVFFTAPTHFVNWRDGAQVPALIGVISRPTLLYQRLFASSVRLGVIVRDALIGIALFFLLMEMLAFLMAVRLSRSITSSIAGLYGATMQIDRGNLAHRIHVERRDQLAALSTSFNTMAGSIEHLLGQQREKERIQSELAIAQEVQNNLFPHAPIALHGFEVHGVCKPARSVSGDYYDFIVGEEGVLCLALGDISGKGISAALLMASLHSAVRAYRFAGETLDDTLQPCEDAVPDPQAASDSASTFASPGKLLALLNRHLYSSTQPEKYATLFVAVYDSSTRRLVYSNGGQLPPLVLCADGSVKRLDCGGSVVGLLDGMSYEEATITLDPGDLLVAYSDGVTEPENEFGEFGEDRLLAIIRQHQNQPLGTISSQTMRALHSWIGTAEQPDDITLVLARQL